MKRIELTKDNTVHPCFCCTESSLCENPHAIGNRNFHNKPTGNRPKCFIKRTLVFGYIETNTIFDEQYGGFKGWSYESN